MDECDIANDIAEKYLTGAILAVLDSGFRRNDRSGGQTECSDCGMEIPEARRTAVPGCERCVGCQGKKEKTVIGDR